MPDQPAPAEERTPDVPDELLLLALSAFTGKKLDSLYDLIEVDSDDHEAVERVLRAVLPEHDRQVRAQVASERRQEPDSLTVYPANEKLYGRCDTCGEVRWHTEYDRAGCESERSEHCGCCVHPHDLGRGWHENWKPGVAHTCVLCPDSPKSARREGQ